jgi:mannitol/fructose-specific phosphotransferase system IIA component (Ntr-type)
MHPTANHLTQLQELIQVREEQRIAGGTAHLEQINSAITAMTAELPADTRVTFEKLFKKDQHVIVPVSERICSVCGIELPRSLVQQVRLGEALQSCPNCARFLYVPEVAAARNVKKRPGRFDARKPGIARFSAASLMICDLDCDDKDSAIAALAGQMEAEGFVDKGDVLLEEALRREALYSTAVDFGLAFPHVRGVEGGALALAIGVSKKGIHFDGPEGELSHIIFFIVIPTAASAFYLKLLSGLTETFMNEEARAALMSAEDQTAMWKTLVKVTRKAIK